MVWPLVRIVEKNEAEQSTVSAKPKPFLYKWSGHRASVTTILLSTGISNSLVVTSSLDQTCKVWSLGYGQLLQSFKLHAAIVSAVLHENRELYMGTTAGNIVNCVLDLPYISSSSIMTRALCSDGVAHGSSVNALALWEDGISLLSGSDDKFIRKWDIRTAGIVKEQLAKGPVTNLLIVPQGTVSAQCNGFSIQNPWTLQVPFSDSFNNSVEGFCEIPDPIVHLHKTFSKYKSSDPGHAYSVFCLDNHIIELQHESTQGALEMKINMLRERKVQACKTSQEYVKQIELLRALYSEIHH
ncbi:hypothetical protein KP509_19G040300 [Ceratopteris richardii]|nr:hypothetical protein KP509_19G040300 [Ceratopteris richardii]KAH7352337.1 hypothetical protein KP509_19G040300 [Ceratopteris richardii]